MKKYCVLSILFLITGYAFFTIATLPLVKSPAVTTQFPNRIQEVLPSVVHIMCDRWQGSGVAVTEDIVVTARHVVDGSNYIITLNDGTEIKGIHAISHKDYDIGFIKVDIPILKPAKFGSVKDCVLGQPVFVIGSPFGKQNFNSVTLGIISAMQRDRGKFRGWQVTFQIDAGANPGSSGGPVFNMNGEIIGIVVGGPTRIFAGIVYIVPIDLVTNDLSLLTILFVLDNYEYEE